MLISYADACSLMLENPAPMLYLDTCILLDVVRSPVRDSIDSNSAKLAKSLTAQSNTAQRSLWLVTSATVYKEWQENIEGVSEEVKKEIRDLESKRAHFLSTVKSATNIEYQDSIFELKGILHLLESLKFIADSLLHACLVISPEDVHLIGAMNRVKQYLPPARRGKAEPKDCEIYELFLGLCKDLLNCNSGSKFVFLSSNTKEYGQSNSGGVQPELNKWGAKYASSLAWAEAILDNRA